MAKSTCVGCGVVGDLLAGGRALNGKDGPLCSDCMRAVTNSVIHESAVGQGMSTEAANLLLSEGIVLVPQWWVLRIKLLEKYPDDFLANLIQLVDAGLRDNPSYPFSKVYTDTWGLFTKRPEIYIPFKGTKDADSVADARSTAMEIVNDHAKAKVADFYEIPDPTKLD